MKHYTGYQLVHEVLIINEMSTTRLVKHQLGHIFRNVKKDPISNVAAIINTPTGIGLHLARNPGSRMSIRRILAKMDPRRLDARARKKANLMKYLQVSKSLVKQ